MLPSWIPYGNSSNELLYLLDKSHLLTYSLTDLLSRYGNSGNELLYLLDKSHEHAGAMAQHLKQWFGPSNPKEGKSLEGFEEPLNWEAVPSCVHTLVQQLRETLVCPQVHTHIHIHIYLHTHIHIQLQSSYVRPSSARRYIHIYIYIYICIAAT